MGFTAFGAAWIEHRPPWTDAVVALAVGLVIGLEAMNSAVEALVNLAHPGWGPQAGKVKDMAAAAVLVAALGALAAGIVMFGPALPALPADLAHAWARDRAVLVLWCVGFVIEFMLAFVIPPPRKDGST